MKKFIGLSLFLFILLGTLSAQEGMWLPNYLVRNEAEMRSMGMKMTADEIYSELKPSLKDAIVQFDGGCTASLISPNGLLLTNHHCGFDQIQDRSTMENNYVEDGFWAATMADELPNPGLEVMFVVRMEDVTAQALEGVSPDLPPRDRQSLVDANLDKVRKNAALKPHEEAFTQSFYEGLQYFLFVTVTYTDVRLVGAPPSSVGKFGDDTDNWVWPRHSGDFSLFRIYSGRDNLPAGYSASNVPFQSKHFLPISIKGVKEGDFTLVMGFPGRTSSYLPSYGVNQVLEVTDPIRIGMRDISLGHIGEAMRKNPETKLKYASKQSGISNGWKKWKGEMQGLRKAGAIGKKQHVEEQFDELLRDNSELNGKFGHLLQDFRSTYSEMEPFHRARTYYTEAVGVNIELFRVAFRLARLVRTFQSQGETGYRTNIEPNLAALNSFYAEYDPGLDQKIFAGIMEKYFTEVNASFLPEASLKRVELHQGDYAAWAAELYGATLFADPEKLKKLLEGSPEELVKALESDPFYQLANELNDAYSTKVAPVVNEFTEHLNELQRQYMQGLIEAFPNKRFYPDANGTLRVTYGKVAGYSPRDGVKYGFQTTLAGVMEKYIPGDYEYDVSEKLRQLYDRKDYGPYGVKGEMPVGFIGTNHTTGGNSGSPVVDGAGNLIGLNFDRVWEGTMSDIYYDGALCRNIMVDARYLLFIIDKLGGAERLVGELKIVK
ncbi:MAG: S46 family peptidase [Saprospirales bacterium]|nr:S46 family peptidase [Saprospirales bacterium]